MKLYIKMKTLGCVKITTVFSHAQTVVLCVGCNMVLCQPTGGLARVTTGRKFYKINTKNY
jgi:small subunit ribosomal protein S27e